MQFQQKHSLQKRIQESVRILKKYPDRVPIICSPTANIKMEKTNFLVPKDMTAGELMATIRARTLLKKEDAIFMFVNNTIPINSILLSQLYDLHKHQDGFLYISYVEENTFG